MGTIQHEVREKHLIKYPKEEDFLKPFLIGFDISWGRKIKRFNTSLSVYFLKPDSNIEEAYGFTKEILLVYSEYDTLESRTIQATELFLTELPAAGRVENLNYFLVSECPEMEEWIQRYISEKPESRIIVPYSANSLRNAKGDSYFVRRTLNHHLYGRDLFDYRLPLETDYYFFGRKDIVANVYDSINKNENKGIFGLRKTGKTSILYKIERQVKSNNIGHVFYFDCKSPAIRKRRWFELYEKICNEIAKRLNLNITGNFNEINVADTFNDLIEKSKEFGKIVLIFDEIEYISPISVDDKHWKNDFISFWQTFWAVQSRQRNISAIIVGVNPYPCEVDRIENIQNPLFGIVSYQYLRGLSFEDMKLMVRTLGNKMGLKFEYDAIKYIYERYGGHPLLTRIACSQLNSIFIDKAFEKPVKISQDKIKEFENVLDATLFFYSGSVVSELEQFYKKEYELLELIASGQTTKYLEQVKYPEYTKHLHEYGLLSFDANNIPKVSIPIIGRYVGLGYMNRENRKTIYKLIEPENREIWINSVKRSIITDIRAFEKLIKIKNLPSLFGPNSFCESDQFSEINVVKDKSSYGSFINVSNRCFVESIEKYGKSISRNDYFWKEIKQTYPDLWRALYRIKLYRHAIDHLDLKDGLYNDLMDFIKLDFEGKKPDQIPDVHFFTQQCILDSMLLSIQVETNKLIG